MKSGRLPNSIHCYYKDSLIDVVNKCTYIGIVVTNTISGQAMKAVNYLK